MNKDIFEGKWKQARGELKKQWGKLTDDELDQVQGNADKLAGLLQEKYGYAKERADELLNEFAARTEHTAVDRDAVGRPPRAGRA